MLATKRAFAVSCAVFVFLECQGSTLHTKPVVSCRTFTSTVIDCSHESLTSVPNETFPQTTEKLDLSFNQLKSIDGFTFRKLQNLLSLDLSNNEIFKLHKYAFVNLKKLVYLNINSNEIILSDQTYSPHVFKPLQSLQVLHMEDNQCKKLKMHSIFPTAVSVLTSLQELYTDFPTYVTFTKEFSNLTNLRVLSSSGFQLPNKKHHICCVKRIYNTTFKPFTDINIKEFRLSYSCLSEIQRGVFAPFNHLNSFELIGNQQLGFYWALQSLYGLQNKTISNLSLKAANSYVRRRHRDFSPNLYTTRFLRTICVESLDVSENFLYMPNTVQLSRSDCLRKFDMSVHITDADLLILKLIKNKPFPKLRFLNISMSNINNPSPSKFESNSNLMNNSSVKLNLHTIDLSYLPMKCEFYSKDFITLRVLNISGWNCTIATPGFFLDLTNVTHLSARNAKLNFGLMKSFSKGSIFRNMINLEMVDLSENGLTILPDDLFLQTNKLASVLLFNNKLVQLPVEIFKKTLEYLDLSNNAIEYLTLSEITNLEKQKQRAPNFHLTLVSNPFVCNCISLEFLQWLNSTDMVSDFGPNYLCRLGDGKLTEIIKFMNDFENFSVSCVSKAWLKTGIASMLGLVILIVLLAMYYRNRWNVHYWFYTNCRPTAEMLPKRQYEYDAFVCYNHNDFDWVVRSLKPSLEDDNRGVRLCLHHRDFEAGEAIQQNIVDAVNKSRKIILVISKNFVSSTWGEYEIEMAGMRSVQDGRANVIISVLLEEVPVGDMPRSLMNLWHKVTFLVWPQNDREKILFWERLTRALE